MAEKAWESDICAAQSGSHYSTSTSRLLLRREMLLSLAIGGFETQILVIHGLRGHSCMGGARSVTNPSTQSVGS